MLGARSPDETGMLKMAPLGQSFAGDSDEDGAETRFFTSAPPPSQGPPTGGAGPSSGPPVGTPPPSSFSNPPSYGMVLVVLVPLHLAITGAPPPSYGQPQGLHQSQASMPPAQSPMGIGLGAAAGSGGPGVSTPFSGANVQSNYVGTDEAEGRTGSMRVWVLVAVIFVLFGGVLIGGAFHLFNPAAVEPIASNEDMRKQGFAIEPSMEEEVYEDPEPVEPVAATPAPTPNTRRRSTSRRSSSSGRSGASGGGAASAPAFWHTDRESQLSGASIRA